MNLLESQASKQTVLDMYCAASNGDFAKALSFMSDDIAIVEPPYLPYGGTYRGKAEFLQLLEKIEEHLVLATTKMESIVAEGDTVFVCLEIGDRKTGKLLQLVERSIVHDGKIVEIKLFYFDAGAMIEAGLKARA
ncbi:MAG: nuclear transport factor 2 family protein [Betaproteobacteria bacterium HGW-Betaproteobacteria-4]|jgi:hypothetical protein|nr:MAG: nuclear transport factor 2 family protein [Betaproteobacteria bacterium HGW-Betaproteobacteria-4]